MIFKKLKSIINKGVKQMSRLLLIISMVISTLLIIPPSEVNAVQYGTKYHIKLSVTVDDSLNNKSALNFTVYSVNDASPSKEVYYSNQKWKDSMKNVVLYEGDVSGLPSTLSISTGKALLPKGKLNFKIEVSGPKGNQTLERTIKVDGRGTFGTDLSAFTDNLLKELYIQPSTKSLKVPTTDKENVYDLNPLCVDKYGVKYAEKNLRYTYSLSSKIDGVYVENNQLHITKAANQSSVNSFKLTTTATTNTIKKTTATQTTSFSLVREKYNVQYHTNAGETDTVSRMPNKQVKTALVNLNLSSAVPVRVDEKGKVYDFLGWATTPTGKVAYQPKDVYKTNEAIDLYAIWQRHDFDILGTDGGKGYLIESTDANPVKYGDDYHFSVKMDEVAYELAPGYTSYIVKVNDQPMTSNNGIYTLEKLMNDTTITVEGLQLKQFKIEYTQPSQDDDKYYTLDINGQDGGTVGYGENAVIKINDLDEKWDPNEIYLKVGNENIKPNANGEYIIENITQDTTISVENFKKKTFTISTLNNQCDFIDEQNNVIQMPLTVEYGDNLSFKVQLKEGYSIADQMSVSINNQSLTSQNNIYTLLNIKEDSELKVDGIDVSSYDINFNDGSDIFVVRNYTGDEVSNAIENNKVSVKHGNSYQFVVETQEGYDPQTVVVKIDNQVIKATTDAKNNNVYTIPDIRHAKDVKINVSLKKYIMTTNQPAITLKDENNNNNVVEHGHDYSFTITKDEKHYTFDDGFKLYYNGKELTPNEGVYTIQNVTNDDLQITTEGVTAKQYPIEIVNIPDELQVKPEGNIDYNSEAKFYLEPKDSNNNPYVMDSIVIDGVKPVYDKDSQQYIYTIKADNEVEGKLQFTLDKDSLLRKNYKLTDKTSNKEPYELTVINGNSDFEVSYGQDLQIKVTLKDNYGLYTGYQNYPDPDYITVYDNTNNQYLTCDKIIGSEYYYTFKNIQSNIDFSIGNISKRDSYYIYQRRRIEYRKSQKITIQMESPDSVSDGNWNNTDNYEDIIYPNNHSGLLTQGTEVKLKITAHGTASWTDWNNSYVLLYNAYGDYANVLQKVKIENVTIKNNTAVGYATFQSLGHDTWVDIELSKKTTSVRLPDSMNHYTITDIDGEPLKNIDGNDAKAGDLVSISLGEQLNWSFNADEGYEYRQKVNEFTFLELTTSDNKKAWNVNRGMYSTGGKSKLEYVDLYEGSTYKEPLTISTPCFVLDKKALKFGFYTDEYPDYLQSQCSIEKNGNNVFLKVVAVDKVKELNGVNYNDDIVYGTDITFIITFNSVLDVSDVYDIDGLDFTIEGIDPDSIIKGKYKFMDNREYISYTIKNVTQDLKITMNDINTKKYQVSYDDTGTYSLDYAYNEEFTDLIEDGKVDSGRGAFYVRIKPKDGYEVDSYSTQLFAAQNSQSEVSLTHEESAIFKFTPPSYNYKWSDIHLRVLGLKANNNPKAIDFQESYVSDNLNQKVVIVQGAQSGDKYATVNSGETLRFKIIPGEKYVVNTLAVTNNGQELKPDENGIYTLAHITSNQTIHYDIKGQEKTFRINLPYLGEGAYCDAYGNPITTSTTVVYGRNFKFTIDYSKLDSQFDIDVYGLDFNSNGQYIYQSSSNEWTIKNIREDQNVTVFGLIGKKHQISFKGADESTYEIVPIFDMNYNLEVMDGGKPIFEIIPKGDNSFDSVRINGQVITPDKDGRYIYQMSEPVMSDMTLILSLGTDTEPEGPLTLQWNDNRHAHFIADNGSPVSTEVAYSESYRFKVNVDDGYDATKLVVKANGVVLTPNKDQVYTLSDVVENQNISIEGIELKSYAVDVQYKDDTNNAVQVVPVMIPHGTNGQLKVNANTGYDISLLNAVLEGKSLRYKDTWENGRLVSRTFTLDNVVKTSTVVLSGASRERFAIELPVVPGCTIERVNEDDQLTSVISGNSYQLKLVIAEGFEDNAVVKAIYDDGHEVKFDRKDNIFTLNEVKGFFKLEIEGINDTIAPSGEIMIENNIFKELFNSLTFNQFFKDKVDIRIEGYDAGSGIDTIQYYLKSQNTGTDQVTQPLTQNELASLTDWQDYTIGESVTLEETQNVVVYAKIKDVAGNITYLSSDGAVIYKDPFIDPSSSLTYDFNEPVNEQSLLLSHVSSIDKVLLDGEIIDPSYYELNNGNLIFKNLNSLLSQVSLGQHEISISVKPNGVANETLITPMTVPLDVQDTKSNHTHDWQDDPSDSRNQEATYLKSGQKVQKCNECDRYQLIEIPKLEDTTNPDISFVVNGDDEHTYTQYNGNPNQLYLDQTPMFSISAQAKDEQTDIKEMSYFVASETLSQNQLNSLDWQPLLMTMALSASHYTHNGLALIDIPENTSKQIIYVKVVNGVNQVSYASSDLYIIDSKQPEIIDTQMKGIELLSNGVTIATSDSTISASVKDDNSGLDVNNSAIIFTPVTGEDENGFIYDEDQASKKSISSQGQVTLQLNELLGENKFSGKVELFVSDNAGNTTSRILVNHLVIDSDEPLLTYELTGTKTSAGYYSNPDDIQFKLEIKDSENTYSSSGIASVSVKDGNQEIYSNKYSQFVNKVDINDINLSTLKDGIHQLTIEVKDNAGNVKTMTLQDIKIDFIDPHVQIKDSSTVGINQASLDMNSSDTGTLYYLLLSSNDAQPTINNLLASSTKKTVTENEDIQLKLQNLTANKDYKLYYLVENSVSQKTSQIQTYELHTLPKQDISQNVALKKDQWTYGDQVSEVELNVGQYELDINKLDISYQKGNTVLNQIPTLPGQYQAVINYEDDVMIIHKTLNFTIQQKELTLNTDVLTVLDKKYDGTKDATVNGLNQLQLSGVVNQDDVQLNVNDVKATFDQKDIGEDISVAMTGLKLIGQAKDYYKLPEIELNASITKANGIDNPVYAEGLLTIQNMHFIENITPSTSMIDLPDGWRFKTNMQIKATSSANQVFEFIYESQDSNYENVDTQVSLPISRIEVNSSLVTMTQLQKAELVDTGLKVVGASLSLTDLHWQTTASNIVMSSDSVNQLNITSLKNGLAIIELHHGQDDTVLAVFNILVNDVHANTNVEDIRSMLDQLKNLDPKDPLSKDLSEAVLDQVVSMESAEKEKISVDTLEELEELLKATHDVESQTTVTNDSIVRAEDIHVIGSIPSSGMTEGTMETIVNTGMSDDPLNPELKIDVVLNHDNQEKEMQTPIYIEMTLPKTINLETSRLVKVHEDGSLEEIEFVFDKQWVRIKVSDDRTLMFVPKEMRYTIETKASNGGTISPLGKTIVKEHDNLDITITPNNGYYIDKIIIDGKVIETMSSYRFTDIIKNHTIYVSFVIDDSQVIKPDKNETSQSQTQVNQTNANTAKTADQMLPAFWMTSGLLAMVTFIALLKKKKHE